MTGIPHLLLILILFFSCSHSENKKNIGEELYQKALKKFNSISEAKSEEQGENIKSEAYELFKMACDHQHQKSCEEKRNYESYISKKYLK